MKIIFRILPVFCLIVLFSSCSDKIYPLGKENKRAYKSNIKNRTKAYKKFVPVKLPEDSLQPPQFVAPSPNFDVRNPELVIIHYTAQQSCEQSLKTLANNQALGKVSAHYLICKDGTVYNMVDASYRAWHGGLSRWNGMGDINSLSLGIELDNNGDEEFSAPLIQSLLLLLESIKDQYNILTGNFVGHADIAPLRKQDPGKYFPWRRLAKHGFGYWIDEEDLPELPEHFDEKTALYVIGYDTRDMPAAIKAFKRHFVQTDTSSELSEKDQQILFGIYQKYLNEND